MQFSIHLKEQIMKLLRRIAVGAVASLGLGVALAAFAQPGPMGGGTGQRMGGMHERMAGMMQGSMHGSSADQAAARQLMTAPEREALQEKMRAAKTPEDRQALATATRAEMEKRAKEKGITLPEHGDMGMGMSHGRGQMGMGGMGGNGAHAAGEHTH